MTKKMLFDDAESLAWQAWEAFSKEKIFAQFKANIAHLEAQHKEAGGADLERDQALGVAWRFGFWCAIKSFENGTIVPLEPQGPRGNN